MPRSMALRRTPAGSMPAPSSLMSSTMSVPPRWRSRRMVP
jgi:hypothetical protein